MKRVHCDKCEHFIKPSFKVSFGIINLKPEEKAKCELGKRVMFRNPTSSIDEDYGYPRYCSDFSNLRDVTSNI